MKLSCLAHKCLRCSEVLEYREMFDIECYPICLRCKIKELERKLDRKLDDPDRESSY